MKASKLCVHCEERLRGHVYLYAQSGFRAHLGCVSQPSAAETDNLLVAYKAAGGR